MTSAAFAEEGEFDMARQILQHGEKSRKRVLLGIDEQEIDLKIIGYAIKLCQRVEAGLEIFHLVKKNEEDSSVSAEAARATSRSAGNQQIALQRMGVVYNPIMSNDTLEKELVAHVAKRRDILLVVLGTRGKSKVGRQIKDSRVTIDIFKRLHCPIVVYEDAVEAYSL